MLYERLDRLEKSLDYYENNQAPTFPIYDGSNFPQDAVEGQIAITTAFKIAWFVGGTWHIATGNPVTLDTPQDAIDGQIVITGDGFILFYLGGWYQVNTPDTVVTTHFPQDQIAGQIVIGRDGENYALCVTADGVNWFSAPAE